MGRLSGGLDDVTGDAGYDDPHPPRMGFFTDTSVCIGCKACEVACKEWNEVPEDGYLLTGMSYDNTQELGASTWRHVAFVEKPIGLSAARPASVELPPSVEPVGTARPGMPGVLPHGDATRRAPSDGDAGVRWLMSSDVCKHCTHAACLDVCPTGCAVPDRVRHRRGPARHLQRLRLLRARLPLRRHRPARGATAGPSSARCATTGSRRGRPRRAPRPARPSPSSSVSSTSCGSGPTLRLAELHEQGVDVARLYGRDPEDGVGGDGAFFLLLDEPEVYGLPPDPIVTTRDIVSIWKHVTAAAVALVAALGVASFVGRRRPMSRGESRWCPEAEFESYYGRQILKTPTWKTPDVPLYLFLGGLAGASAVLAEGAALHRPARSRARRPGSSAAGGAAAGTAALVHDLGRPERFLHMLRVFKPTSPLSVGSFILGPVRALSGIAAASQVTGRLPRVGRLAGFGAAALGPPLATYTAALFANTAVPAWHDAHRELPFVFAGSGAAAAGADRRCCSRPPGTPGRPCGWLSAGALLETVADGDDAPGGWAWSPSPTTRGLRTADEGPAPSHRRRSRPVRARPEEPAGPPCGRRGVRRRTP